MSFDLPFAQPAKPGGDPLDLHSLLGSLLVFDVVEVVEGLQTVHTQPGENTTAVRVNVDVLDGAQQGMHRDDALIFSKVLQGQLRPSIGRKVLGRLSKGTPKPGSSAPWVLDAATDADMQQAVDWQTRRSMSTPAPSEAPF